MDKLLVVVCLFPGIRASDQNVLDNISRYLKIRYDVIDNFANSWKTFDGKLTLENTGPDIPAGDAYRWSIYFCHIRLIEPDRIRPDGVELSESGLKAFHINGCLHKLEPMASFAGLPQGSQVTVPFRASDWQVARTDVMPNWYVAAPNASAQTIESTSGPELGWVGDFDTENKYKRQPDDRYSPYTAASRLGLWSHRDTGLVKAVVPTPVSLALDGDKTVNILGPDWLVVTGNPSLKDEAQFLAAKLNTIVVDVSQSPHTRFIRLDINTTDRRPEAYTLLADYQKQVITIEGSNDAGVFYGVQTLLSLASTNGEVPTGHVTDYPRFQYRGIHVDVARNFRPKEDIFRLLDVMAMYKLNKLHLHLTDDEGWRLEIPGLPELTDVGSRRCHDETGDQCLMPQLGSPPGLGSDHGTGYYTVADYKEILKYAEERHIEVIPEFDMPGHAHAAIKSMVARYHRYASTNITAAEQFLLSEIDDPSDYLSVQYFTDNAINPCINSTYAFIRHLVAELKTIHLTEQPLKVFHFGGDEVPAGAWINSSACSGLAKSSDELKELFVLNVANMAADAGLSLAGWEDGFTRRQGSSFVPIDREALAVGDVYTYTWNNIWEWGNGERAYVMANANYTVVLSHATHLYFDHPYEPDPEDRGFYWATRHTSVKKTFGYIPDSLYANIDVDRMGNKLDPNEICSTFNCTPLEAGKESLIIGIQGQVWSETVRTSEDFDYMVYPRLLAMAERAWHKAPWEDIDDVSERERKMADDWEQFANTLGYKEMSRLDQIGVAYAISPPGARVSESTSTLEALAEFPGLPIWFSQDGGLSWHQYTNNTVLQMDNLCSYSEIRLITRSANRVRQSRTATVNVTSLCVSVASSHQASYLLALSHVIGITFILLYGAN